MVGARRETWASRRADNQRNVEALKVLRGRAKHAEAALEPLRARVRELTARAESHAEEVKAVRPRTRPARRSPGPRRALSCLVLSVVH